MNQEQDLEDWDSLPDDTVIQLRKTDLDTIYTSIIQVSLALLAGDAELRNITSGEPEKAAENWQRKVQALTDSREALRSLLSRIAARTGEQRVGHERA